MMTRWSRVTSTLGAFAVALFVLFVALLALPQFLTESRAFTLLFAATFAVVAARVWRKRPKFQTRPSATVGLGGLTALLLIVDVATFVHLPLPFWMVADSASFCAGVGHATKACRAPSAVAARTAPETSPVVHLVAHGWHSGLVIDTNDLDARDLPYASTLKRHRYVEFGWGDADFFQADHPTIVTALDAMLTPGPAVLHVASFDASPEAYFSKEPLYRIPVSPAGLQELTRFVASSFQWSERGEPLVTGPGDYGPDSQFVKATGRYYFPNTCNVWTAKALASADVPMTPSVAVTSQALLHQVERVAFVVH